MSVHEQFAEDLALYALGALQGEERVSLEKHLDGCAGCRRELEQLRGDMALMALSTAGPVPPRRARQRLIEAVAREPRRSVAPARRRWWTLVPWVAAAALAAGLVALWLQNSDLQRRIARLAGSVGPATRRTAARSRSGVDSYRDGCDAGDVSRGEDSSATAG